MPSVSNPVVDITSFYQFCRLSDERVLDLKTSLEQFARREKLRGLCLLGREGINATISGSAEATAKLKRDLQDWFGIQIEFKDSHAAKHPFHVFRVKIKDEIVTLGQPELVPTGSEDRHISPAEWQELLSDPDSVVLDTRNRYEVEIGKFKSAVDLELSEFNEFPEKLKSAAIPKDKRVMIYCTGGIRCEKAILEMRRQGYQNVLQLKGGILNYLKEFPEREFEGECFVFDYRVAVDQKLKPTKRYGLCPHCGQPSVESIACLQCGRPAEICRDCRARGGLHLTCSKNCAHHFELGTGSKKPHLQELKKRSTL